MLSETLEPAFENSRIPKIKGVRLRTDPQVECIKHRIEDQERNRCEDRYQDLIAESAWEIEQRIEAIEAGTNQLESWEQVRQRIERDILGR